MNVGEIAGETLRFIINKMDDKKIGKQFTDELISILTLCISETIKASCCDAHYGDILNEVIQQIKDDLSVK